MLRYIYRRFLHLLPLVIGMTFISFLIIQLAPGDYFTRMAMNPEVSPETITQLRQEFALDKPLIIQYLRWLFNICHLNFGTSFTYHIPVISIVKGRLLNTLLLSVSVMILTWLISIPLGIFAALKENRAPDRLLSGFAFVGISLPSFFLALLLLCFAARSGWFPTGGVASIRYEEFSALGKFVDRIHHLMLPTLVLVICSFGGLFRVMRGNFLENLRAPYITTARAKGLSERKVIYKHILRNSINPLITIFGYELSGLLSGVALVEIILSWPGLGRLMLEAVMAQDLYVVMASLLVGGILLILGNLIADILLAFADPRIRYQ